MGETFKNRFKSTKPINGSIVSLDDESAEMRFEDDDDHQINKPLDFKKINEILDSNNFKSEPRSGFDDDSEYGVSPR